VSTPVLPVPPPRFGLDLVLQCSHEGQPARPTISSLSKYLVATKGGSRIEVLGTGFTPSATVRFGAALSRGVTYVSPNLLDVAVPPGAGRVHVLVTTGGGASVAAAASQITYLASPAISGISPASGPAAGGTRATIHGSGLSGAELVEVGNSPATGVAIEPDGALEITTPPGQKGTVNITVTTPIGTSALTAHGRFTYAKSIAPKQ
jgi:large repetitive protein